MITHLRIENFKCLRDVSLDLRPLTALVGGNDTGKSAILEAIAALSSAARPTPSTRDEPNDLAEGLPFEEIISDGDASLPIRWHLEARSSGGEDFACRVDLRAGVREDAHSDRCSVVAPPGSPSPTLAGVAAALGSVGRYRFEPRSLRAPSALCARPSLSSTGDNLAAVLDAIFCGPDRSASAAIDAALRAAIPTLGGVSLRTIEREGGRVEKAVELLGLAPTSEGPEGQNPAAGLVYAPARRASDGGLLLTAALTLAHSNSPDILLLESPEAGLHPAQIRFLASVLRSISEGAPVEELAAGLRGR